MDTELKEPVMEDCICDLKGISTETAAVWNRNPDALGCPFHGPRGKQYCRIHHNGFFGACHPCLYQRQLDSLGLLLQLLQDHLYDEERIQKDSSEA